MKTPTSRPFVLHVDDVPDDLRTWDGVANESGRIKLTVSHPRNVTEEDLRSASLVLVDFKIEEWLERDTAGSLGLKPTNGLALLSVLQEAAYDLDKARPRAFALFTAAVAEVARGLVPQPHIVARAHNLEWVFDKTIADTATRAQHVIELAEAVHALPRPWPGHSADQASSAMQEWLGLSSVPWRDDAWHDVLRCRPPIHEYAAHTHGIGVLRWALHRILPYPTFLLDDAHLAARLRVDLGSLKEQLAINAQLLILLSSALYQGSLATFAERRWWRSGVESIIFDIAPEDPGSISVLHKHLAALAPKLRFITAPMAFPTIDEDFRVNGQLATAEQVVEVVPDDWPPFADSAWALRTDAEANPDLMAIVIDSDEDM